MSVKGTEQNSVLAVCSLSFGLHNVLVSKQKLNKDLSSTSKYFSMFISFNGADVTGLTLVTSYDK